jgi:hypothetical protein
MTGVSNANLRGEKAGQRAEHIDLLVQKGSTLAYDARAHADAQAVLELVTMVLTPRAHGP